MLKTLNDFMKKQAELEEQNAKEAESMKTAGEEQAKELIEQYKENTILNKGSVEEANRLYAIDETNRAKEGGIEQAKLMVTGNQMKEAGKIQAEMIVAKEKQMKEAGKVQAEMIIATEKQNKENGIIKKGSVEEANRLYAIDETNRAKEAGKIQAQIIVSKEEQSKENKIIKKGSIEESNRLYAIDETNRAKEGGIEQAQNIIKEESLLEKSRNGSDTEIIDIESNETSLMDDLVSQMAYYNVLDEDLLKGSVVQAQEIINKEETEKVILGSVSQAKELIAKDEQVKEEKIIRKGSVEESNRLYAIDETNRAKEAGKEQAQIIFDNEKKGKTLSISTDSNPVLTAMNCVTLNNNDRYCTFVSPSKPIKLRATQKSNLDLRMIGQNKKSENKSKKEILTSLKEQLNSNDFDFLRYDESVVGQVKAA